jgi:hypothetical protein
MYVGPDPSFLPIVVSERVGAMLLIMVYESGGGNDMIGPELEVEFDLIYKRAHTFDGSRYLGQGDWARINEHQQAVRSSWIDNRATNWSLEEGRLCGARLGPSTTVAIRQVSASFFTSGILTA